MTVYAVGDGSSKPLMGPRANETLPEQEESQIDLYMTVTHQY